jgi:tRNA threonylcarbamoyl adenosine modification protein YeaZ
MMILGFTTSTNFNSIACYSKNKFIKPLLWPRKEQQSEALTLHIKNYLKKNDVEFGDLSLIAVDQGPGSFTGTRIAVNVAKTLAYDLNLPVFARSSLDLMATGVAMKFSKKLPFTIFSVLDAHRSLFYFQKFNANSNSLSPQNSIQAQSLEDIINQAPDQGALYLLGDLSSRALDLLKSGIIRTKPNLALNIPNSKGLHAPDAKVLVALASKATPSNYLSWADVEPSYIRSPDAVEKFFSSK